MNKDELDVCKEFLKTSQKGDLISLKKLKLKHNVKDWTLYRHVVSGDTAIHLATREGHYDVVAYLCEAWEKPEFKTDVANKDMKRPLHDAAQFTKPNILRYLIARGAFVDPLKRADWTPLMLACTKTGDEATLCVEILLENGANSNLKNKDGWTPLLLACRTGNLKAVKILSNKCPEIIYAKSKNGRNCLHVAAFHGHVELVDYFLLSNPEVAAAGLINSKDSSGSTPLLESVKGGNFKTFKYLIESKAEVKAVDEIGKTVLHFAAESGNIEIIKYIIDKKFVDTNSYNTPLGITPLMLAQKNNQLKAVEILSSLF